MPKTLPLKIDRSIPPAIKAPVEYDLKLKPYEAFTLDNGIPVYLIDAGEQEVLQMEFVFYAGNKYEQQTGIAAATNSMLKNGTGKRSAFQINEDFEYYGAYCSRACYNETAAITLHSLTKHLDKLFPVLTDMLSDSVIPTEELEIYKQNSIQKMRVNLKKCEFVAGRLIDSYLYGEQHPYGKYNEISDYEKLEVSTLRAFYDKFYRNGNAALFVAGKLPAGLDVLLNQHFGKLTLGKPDIIQPGIAISPSLEKKFRIINDPNAVQGAIRLASHFPNRHHPDFKRVMVLNNLFGGFFGSRLMSNIREDKGYTYGIYSYLQNHIQESAWVVSTEAGKDVCEATVEEIYKEMKRLREENIDDEELSLVRNYMIGGILGDLDGPFHIIAKWKNIILNGLGEDFFNDSVRTIKTISAEELRELANKYLLPEKFYELVVY